MFDPTAGPARMKISAQRPEDSAELRQSAFSMRERISHDDFDALQRNGTLIIDARRRRPLYFDGRFLAARDLTREQNYFLIRQADLGRAGGAGVVHGLLVKRDDPIAGRIRVSSGHGVTTSGEMVALLNDLSLDLNDVAEIQRLDAAFGLTRLPRESARNRSGVFALALRPVEFTANPIASYPTSIDGRRTVEDGEIIEGVVVTLIPWPDQGAGDEINRRRGRIAREIFVAGVMKGVPENALPLAMIALDRGDVKWVDSFMVRREVGAEHGDILGLGFAPRALREAHMLQYERHLEDVMTQRQNMRFAASDVFQALPPAGRMPKASISAADFTQTFFPPEIDVDLSIIPSDEIIAMIEESLLLPPIDLTADSAELDSTSALALIPVERHRLRELKAKLTTQNNPNPLSRPLKTAAPGLVAKRLPLESLIRLPRRPLTPPALTNPVDQAWRDEINAAATIWYVRRRNLNYKVGVAGTALRVTPNVSINESDLVNRFKDVGLATRLNNVKKTITLDTNLEVTSLLTAVSSQDTPASKLIMHGALTELEKSKPETGEAIDKLSALSVSSRFTQPQFGEGLKRLDSLRGQTEAEKAVDLQDDKIVKTLAQAGVVPELDEVARRLSNESLKEFAGTLAAAARTGDASKSAELVNKTLNRLKGGVR
jgi:hypothetical protein